MQYREDRSSRFVFLYILYAVLAFPWFIGFLFDPNPAIYYSTYYSNQFHPPSNSETMALFGLKVFLVLAYLVCQFVIVPRSIRQVKQGADSNEISRLLAIGIAICTVINIIGLYAEYGLD